MLWDNKENHKVLIDRLPIGIVITTPEEISYCNSRALEILGLTREDLHQFKPIDLYVDPQDRSELIEHLYQEGFHEYEYWLQRKDESKILVRGRSIAIRDEHDQIIRYEGYIEDITERKQVEEERKLTLARERVHRAILEMETVEDFEQVVKVMALELRDLGTDFDAVGLNVIDEEAGVLTAYSLISEDFSIQSVNPLDHPANQELVNYWHRNEVWERPPDAHFRDIIERSHGPAPSYTPTVIIDVPFVQGTLVVGLQSSVGKNNLLIQILQEFCTLISLGFKRSIDMTERLQAEEALVAERERLLVTLRSIGDGVITTDAEGKVVLINEVAEKLTGWRQDEVENKPLPEIFHIINEKTRALCENPVEKVLRSGRIAGLANHTALLARDGTERCIADSGAPIRDDTGKMIGVVLVFRDITEQRRIEEELIKTEKLESLGILAGGIAHDFNNILTGIIGNLSMLQVDIDAKNPLFETVRAIEITALQAKNLTQELLTFAKGGEPVRKVTSLLALIKDSSRFALRGSNVRCTYSFSENLWNAEVDEGQISQVIQNLVINADQAMPEGGTIHIGAESITVSAERKPFLTEGRYVKISVVDQGVGIAPVHLQRIFEPYFTTKHKGSGLGLATTYSIIKNHDGHLEVESEMGVGTIFYVYLPASSEEITKVKEEETDLPIGQGSILIMDDEAVIRDLAGRMLTRLGYEVDFADDGTEALEAYRKAWEAEQPFVAVIMDLTIPGGMGGKEAIKRLLEIDPYARVIVSSGYSNDPIMAEFKQYGFRGVVAKPYSITELGNVLHSVITETNE